MPPTRELWEGAMPPTRELWEGAMPPTRELWEGAMPPTVLCWALVARMARSHTCALPHHHGP
jgi:hypothetical protein